jgi:hypothetical protein
MIANPLMLVNAATQAGIKLPDDPEKWDQCKETHMHWYAFCLVQLARPVVYHGEHFENAKVIAAIPAQDLPNLTFTQLIERGLVYPVM